MFSGLDAARAGLMLDMRDSIERLDQISPLKSVGLHALTGDRKGQWAINVNGRWRI